MAVLPTASDVLPATVQATAFAFSTLALLASAGQPQAAGAMSAAPGPPLLRFAWDGNLTAAFAVTWEGFEPDDKTAPDPVLLDLGQRFAEVCMTVIPVVEFVVSASAHELQRCVG